MAALWEGHHYLKFAKKKTEWAGHGSIPVTPALGTLGQEDLRFKASLGYTVRVYLKHIPILKQGKVWLDRDPKLCPRQRATKYWNLGSKQIVSPGYKLCGCLLSHRIIALRKTFHINSDSFKKKYKLKFCFRSSVKPQNQRKASFLKQAQSFKTARREWADQPRHRVSAWVWGGPLPLRDSPFSHIFRTLKTNLTFSYKQFSNQAAFLHVKWLHILYFIHTYYIAALTVFPIGWQPGWGTENHL